MALAMNPLPHKTRRMIPFERFYVYAGMKPSQKTKVHICDDKANVLCGVRSNWMQAYDPISSRGVIKGSEHFPIIQNEVFWGTCSKCIKKWRLRRYDKQTLEQ